MSDLDLQQGSEVTSKKALPTIEALLSMSEEEASQALKGIPDSHIFEMGASVGRQATSYQMFGGISSFAAGFYGDVEAVKEAANSNANRATRLRRLTSLFFDEYDRRIAEIRNANA